MAEATPSGEPPAKRAKVVELDWTVEFAEAKKAYDEAKQELKVEFQKDPQQRDQQCIEFLTANKQEAQKRLEFAQQMLLQAQSRPSEVELTDETIQQMVSAGTWKLPKHEDTIEVLERQPQLDMIVDYIQKVQKGEKDGKGVFPLLGTAGMTGIGKTQLLLNGLKRASELENVKGVFFTFNGQGNLKELFQQSLGTGRQYGDAFGQALLRACEVPRAAAKSCDFDRCLRIIRKLVNADEKDHVVLFIDELGVLDENAPQSANPSVVPLLQALMRLMDVEKNKVVFVFSHLLDAMLKRAATEGSGRPIICLPLAALQIDTWRASERFAVWRQAAAKWSGVHQLLLLCAGHPRSLFDGLQAAAKEQPSLLELREPPVSEVLYAARETIMRVCKFASRLRGLLMGDTTVMQWFNPLEQMDLRVINDRGLLVRVDTGGEEKAEKAFFHPLVLCEWARQCYIKDKSPLAYHLQKAYEFDAGLGEGSEKRMEGLMFHYEAVLRIALAGKPIELRKFYVTNYIGNNFKTLSLVGALPTNAGSLVEFVQDFRDMDFVINLLEKGKIVVSKKQSEEGVEYLTPWRLNDAKGKLVVACVQCKFVKDKVPWDKVKEHMHSAVKPLRTKKIDFFPVIYATPDQDTIQEDTYNDGVYFNEVSIFKFTSKLGILRLHTEKLGKSLQKEVPVLNRSRSEVAD